MRKDTSHATPDLGNTLDLHRARSEGVLNCEELVYCREHKIPIGYDCVQIGWVPLSCEDDITETYQILAKIATTATSTDLTSVIEKLRQRAGYELAPLVEALNSHFVSIAAAHAKAASVVTTLMKEFKFSDNVKILDRCHCVLQNEVAKQLTHMQSLSSTGERFSYRQWRNEDAPKYCQILGNARIWDHLPEEFPTPFTEDLAGELIELANFGDHHEVLAVEYNEEIIGQVRLMFNNDYPEVYSAEIAYLLGEEYWGRGLMPNILCDFTQQSFQKHPLDFIYAWIEANHKASIKCAERAGYRRDSFNREEELAKLSGRPGFLRYICYRPKLVFKE